MSTPPRFELFPRLDLETFGFGLRIDQTTVLRGLERLGRLQRLYRSRHWRELTEINVEQSFVERVLGDIFGYETLLSEPPRSASQISVEVLPKLYIPLPGGRRAFADFALGFFRVDSEQSVICGELKGACADLDAPQHGESYEGRSPVEQAMRAAESAGAHWCIVSNTHEVRLYRVPNIDVCERIDLLAVGSPMHFRRAFALLSRMSLLGSGIDVSPLSRLYIHCQRGQSMLVPMRSGCVRLIQRAKLVVEEELSFTRMSRAIRLGLQRVPTMFGAEQELASPRLQDEQLVLDETVGSDVNQRIAANRSGLLVSSCLVPSLDRALGQPLRIDPTEVLRRLSLMSAFAWVYFNEFERGTLRIEWVLEDLNENLVLETQKAWVRPTSHLPLSCQSGVMRTTHSHAGWSAIAREDAARGFTETISELFFAFEAVDGAGRLCRLEPSQAEVAEFLAEQGILDLFGEYRQGRFINPLES